MSKSTTSYKGIVHGRTIELDQETGLAEGAAVDVTIQPVCARPASIDEIRAAVDATAGACADDADELDEFDVTTRTLRHMDSH